ncbi:MAG: hypothetical protein ACJ79S_18190 [Gemmatimonadaceae bacterium]
MTKRRRKRSDDERIDVRGADVQDVSDQVRASPRNDDPRSYPDRDYGFSGRDGFQEGNYSSYYGRGTAGERNAPSASGYAGAGYDRGGTDIPGPDREPPDAVRVDDSTRDDAPVERDARRAAPRAPDGDTSTDQRNYS